jgi:hypothetical protein
MRDIREDLLQRRLSIVGRYFDAMAQFEDQLQKLHEGHRKLMEDIKSEKGAVDTMLAIENSRPIKDLRDTESQATTVLLQNLSEIVQRYPWEKSNKVENPSPPPEREATLVQNSTNRTDSY